MVFSAFNGALWAKERAGHEGSTWFHHFSSCSWPCSRLEENLQELQSFIERRGAPWHKSDDPEERRMALFVRHLLSLKKRLGTTMWPR